MALLAVPPIETWPAFGNSTPLMILLIVVYAVAVFGFTLVPGIDAAGQPWRMGFLHAFYFVSFLGTTIGLGLLFDTLIVRSFMMPSAAAMLGRWFWWPQNVRTRPSRARHRAGSGDRPSYRRPADPAVDRTDIDAAVAALQVPPDTLELQSSASGTGRSGRG